MDVSKEAKSNERASSLLFLPGGRRDLLPIIIVTYHTLLRRPLEKQTVSTARKNCRQWQTFLVGFESPPPSSSVKRPSLSLPESPPNLFSLPLLFFFGGSASPSFPLPTSVLTRRCFFGFFSFSSSLSTLISLVHSRAVSRAFLRSAASTSASSRRFLAPSL